MPNEPKSNAKSDTAGELIQREIERARNNLQCAIHGLGHAALQTVNPITWLKRYPVKCSIATGMVLAGGAVAAVLAVRNRPQADPSRANAPPINVYVKKPKAQFKGWGNVGTALLAALTSHLKESLKATLVSSLADRPKPSPGRTVFVPNPTLRDVHI
jgi:hypothetical protein